MRIDTLYQRNGVRRFYIFAASSLSLRKRSLQNRSTYKRTNGTSPANYFGLECLQHVVRRIFRGTLGYSSKSDPWVESPLDE